MRLAATANQTLARDVYRRYREDRRRRAGTDFPVLGEIFVRAIVHDFARGAVERDFRSFSDVGIVEAIKRDARRAGQDWKARLRSLVDLVSSQSDPFLTLTDPGHGQRSMYWAGHPEVRRDIADEQAFETLFTFNQGEQSLVEEAFSRHQPMCFNSKVLLELVHLTKLQVGAAGPRTVTSPAPGRSFEAYSRMVEGLIEEDLDPRAKSPHITPHLDGRWHKPGILPEISPGLSRLQRADSYRALAVAFGLGLIVFDTHYGEAVATYSTLGRVAKSGVAIDVVASHDWWTVTEAFLARSELVRATDRF